MSMWQDEVLATLSEGGALDEALSGFKPRAGQQRMAAAVADAIATRGTLLAEAGTGTGKTYAYLVPLLLSGKKAIVSTGTRALQDQLFHRDLPRVRDALGQGAKTALLKGRANYLCFHRMELAKGESRFGTREHVDQFQRIVSWSGRTTAGDLAEVAGIPDDSPVLPMVTSTTDNCLGTDCPFWADCFVVKARQRAQAADLVVVNHHLLLADLALKQEGFGEILPGAEAFVIDEAHQLPELAALFFGEALSARQIVECARECVLEAKSVATGTALISPVALQVENSAKVLRQKMEGIPTRGTRDRLNAFPEVQAAALQLGADLEHLIESLKALEGTSTVLDALHTRAALIRQKLTAWFDTTAEVDPDEALSVHWYELSARGFRLSRTPIDVSGALRTQREASGAAWVFTSATLSIAGQFSHAVERLGLDAPTTLLEPSPFAWAENALCYLPTGLPQPSDRHFTHAMMERVVPVLKASNGRAFVLFASHRALREAAELLAAQPWPLFVQGQAPRAQLLDQFRASGNGVLLGTASFREGVDVAGDALSVVVVDKLPFAAPDDPVFEARLDAIRRAGGVPFRDEQIPQAVIAMKQGVGRLIRTETDRGVLVLCDPRLTEKSYGRTFIDSLPPAVITRRLEDVEAFFAAKAELAA
jgi:ATP-dependent DNA helicase DinG